VPDPSVRPSPEDRPTFDEPAPTDVTAAEITGLLEDGLLPLAPAHGGAFETMVNSLDAQPAFDVMLLGDSMVQQGVDPAVMSTELSGVGADVTVFNAASSRARWGINLMLAKHLTQTDKTPRVALVGITTRAGENDLFYSSEASRSPFSAVVEGCDRPRTSTWTPGVESSCRRAVTDPLQVISFELPHTPAHQDNLQEVGRNYDQRRQRVATELATAAGIPHIPVDRFGSWWGDGDSRDAIHLAPLGAAKFTRQLLDTPRLRQQLTP